MGCIYRIICYATGKCYIGQTSYSHPFVRFREHQQAAKNGEEGPLYDDLRTYDIHEFECECVCVVPNTKLNSLECYYIEQYNAEYNISEGGKAIVRSEIDDTKRMWMKRRAIFKNFRK